MNNSGQIRNTLNLTQKDVSNISGVSMDTLRKIENGKVIPNQITLELISAVLKEDLNTLLLKYRLKNTKMITELLDEIDKKLDNEDYENILIYYEKLKKLLVNEKEYDSINNEYVENIIKQKNLFYNGILCNINSKDLDLSLSYYEASIKITTPDFNVNKIYKFNYNDYELRILMNMGLIIFHNQSNLEGIDILKFCLKNTNDIKLKIRCIYNLSNCYYQKNDYYKSLTYANHGIQISIEKGILNFITLLYARKSIAEFYLKDSEYISSFKKTFTLFDVLDQKNLREKFLDSCKNMHNIDIEYFKKRS